MRRIIGVAVIALFAAIAGCGTDSPAGSAGSGGAGGGGAAAGGSSADATGAGGAQTTGAGGGGAGGAAAGGAGAGGLSGGAGGAAAGGAGGSGAHPDCVINAGWRWSGSGCAGAEKEGISCSTACKQTSADGSQATYLGGPAAVECVVQETAVGVPTICVGSCSECQ